MVVTDRDGRCVGGLTAADFEILEDGKTRPVSHFAEEARPGFRAGAAAPAAPGPSPEASAAAPAPAARGRHLVLAVDDLHTAAGNLGAAKTAMNRFVDEQVSPDDFVALVTTSGSVGVYQDFTRDPRALHRAIDRVTSRYVPVEPGGTPYLSEYQAELIDRGDVEALRVAVQEILQTEDYRGETGAREQAYTQARRMVFEIMDRSGRALAAIEGVVRGLAPVPGRKIVVLVSDGFLVGLGAAENRTFDVRRITDAATKAGVVLYALHSRGLVADVPGGSASFQGPGVLTAPGARANLQARGNEAQKQGLNALAEDTGGFLVQNSNDLAAGFGRILRDNEVYYLLAYEPANTARDGKFRKIEVQRAGAPRPEGEDAGRLLRPGRPQGAGHRRDAGGAARARDRTGPRGALPARRRADADERRLHRPASGGSAGRRARAPRRLGRPLRADGGALRRGSRDRRRGLRRDGRPRRQRGRRPRAAQPHRGELSAGSRRRPHRAADGPAPSRPLPGTARRARGHALAPRQRARVGRDPGRGRRGR